MNPHEISIHKISRDLFAGRRWARYLNNRFFADLQSVARFESTPMHAGKRQVFPCRAAINGMTFVL